MRAPVGCRLRAIAFRRWATPVARERAPTGVRNHAAPRPALAGYRLRTAVNAFPVAHRVQQRPPDAHIHGCAVFGGFCTQHALLSDAFVWRTLPTLAQRRAHFALLGRVLPGSGNVISIATNNTSHASRQIGAPREVLLKATAATPSPIRIDLHGGVGEVHQAGIDG